MTVEPFVMRIPRPPRLQDVDWDGLLGTPLRWAIVAVEGDQLVIAGARLCS